MTEIISIPYLEGNVRLYLNPLGIIYRDKKSTAAAALPLAGGALSFMALEIIISSDQHRIFSAVFPVSSISKLRRILPQDLQNRFDFLLFNITEPRLPYSNLNFDRPLIMGILNITPDSFSDGGDTLLADHALMRMDSIVQEGADIIDIGAESTRPESIRITASEELKRLKPILNKLTNIKIPVSIDTQKSIIMKEAIIAGASVVNDVSALRYDKKSLSILQKMEAGVILMHMQGTPSTMQNNPFYKDVILEIFDFLEDRIAYCLQRGLPRYRLFADPGFGFGKTYEHNMMILKNLSFFHGLGVPIVVGLSRKRFLGELTNGSKPKNRLGASLAGAVMAVNQGIQIVRCHDVAATRQALNVIKV